MRFLFYNLHIGYFKALWNSLTNEVFQNLCKATPAIAIIAIFIREKRHICLIIAKKCSYENGKSPRKQTITYLCRKLNKSIEFVPLINKAKQQLCNVCSLSNMSRIVVCVLRLVQWIIYLKSSRKPQWITSNLVEYNRERICNRSITYEKEKVNRHYINRCTACPSF